MILTVGGAYQGKEAFARELIRKRRAEGEYWQLFSDLHLWVRDQMEQELSGTEPKRSLLARLEEEIGGLDSNTVILCNELGCGVVPMEARDRAWREQTGRLCCELAEQAKEVYRVTCGIAMQIK